MLNETLDKLARTFAYELKSYAIEYGFKAEAWIIKMVTIPEKKNIESEFYPTLSIKVLPETSAEMWALIVKRLTLSTTDHNNELDSSKTLSCQYLIAYNPERKI